MSSTIQTPVFPINSTLDHPGTPAGDQWKTALSHLASYPSFFSAWWGRHLEVPEHVSIVADWNTSSAAQIFLSRHYTPFAARLKPLLATPPDIPAPVEINLMSIAEPAALPAGGGLTTIRKLGYSSLNADQRFHLLAPTFNIYVQELAAAAAGAAGFKGGNAAWAVDATGAKTPTLWMLMSWESMEAEQRCEDTSDRERAQHEGCLSQEDAGTGRPWRGDVPCSVGGADPRYHGVVERLDQHHMAILAPEGERGHFKIKHSRSHASEDGERTGMVTI